MKTCGSCLDRGNGQVCQWQTQGERCHGCITTLSCVMFKKRIVLTDGVYVLLVAVKLWGLALSVSAYHKSCVTPL